MCLFTASLRYEKYLSGITLEELADPFTRFQKIKDAEGEERIEIRRNIEYALIYKSEIERRICREEIALERERRQQTLAAAAAATLAEKLVCFESL